MTPPLDDSTLEALLAAPPAELADEGFSAAVMRRVQADEAAQRWTVEAASALACLRARDAADARRGRWRLGGAAVGAVLAAAMFVLAGGTPAEWATTQALGLLLALGASTWALASGALRGTHGLGPGPG